MNIEDVKQKVADSARRLIDEGLVAGTWGNISVRLDRDTMVITPSGIDYKSTTKDDMVIVSLENGEYEGRHKPSSEYKLHKEVYLRRKEINAVIHTHSMNVSTVAAARREVPPILDDMAQIIGPSIRVAKYALPSTKKIVKTTVKALRGRNGALMANHGGIGLGRNLEEAFTACIIMEKACKAFIEAEFLGGAKSIHKFEAYIMHQYYLKKYSKQN